MKLPTLNRRRLIQAGFYSSVAGVVGETFLVEPHWLQIVEHEMKIPNLHANWRGKTILQISDIHVGPQVSDNYVIKSFERVEELKPDIVVYTGDFISIRRDGFVSWEQISQVYQHAPRGTQATLGILGNHDYFGDRAQTDRLVSQLGDFGIDFLLNDARDLGGLRIAGVEDLWEGNCDVESVIPASTTDMPHIVLCHNPDGADLPQWKSFQGWILAGHTHGGQCKPPFLPPPLLPVENRRYTAGQFDLYDGRQMYINRGVGHLIAVRFNCRPEITLFHLT